MSDFPDFGGGGGYGGGGGGGRGIAGIHQSAKDKLSTASIRRIAQFLLLAYFGPIALLMLIIRKVFMRDEWWFAGFVITAIPTFILGFVQVVDSIGDNFFTTLTLFLGTLLLLWFMWPLVAIFLLNPVFAQIVEWIAEVQILWMNFLAGLLTSVLPDEWADRITSFYDTVGRLLQDAAAAAGS